MSNVRFSIQLHEWRTALNQMINAPTAGQLAALEAVLHSAFEDTQARVHVISGALKASGQVHTSLTRNEWEGAIEYGGPSSPHYVDYAIFEMARGGDHDFFSGLPAFYQAFEDAVATWPT